MSLHDDVFATVAAVEAVKATAEQAIVDELVARGYDPLRAELLAVFVPLGLGRALIASLPVKSPIVWSESAVVCDFERKRELPLKLSAVPEFQTAQHIGEEVLVNGIISRDRFSVVISFSVELKLINEVLDSGRELDGCVIAAPRLLRLANRPGFEEWYRVISSRSN